MIMEGLRGYEEDATPKAEKPGSYSHIVITITAPAGSRAYFFTNKLIDLINTHKDMQVANINMEDKINLVVKYNYNS